MLDNVVDVRELSIQKHLEEVRTEIELVIPDNNLLSKMFIAGGSIRSLATYRNIVDYDIFLKDSDGIRELKETLAYRQVLYESKNSIGLITSTGKHIQFIICASGDPESVVGEFDFTCNQNHWDMGTRALTIHPDAYTMNLRINPNARNAMGTFLRVGKFLTKGYTYPPREDMIHLGVKMTQHDPITTYSELDESSRMNFTEEETKQVSEIIQMDIKPVMSVFKSRIGSAGGA